MLELDPLVKTPVIRLELLPSPPLPEVLVPLVPLVSLELVLDLKAVLVGTTRPSPTRLALPDTSSPLPLPTSSKRGRLPVTLDTPTTTSLEVVSDLFLSQVGADLQNPSLTPSLSTLADLTVSSMTKRPVNTFTDTNSRARSKKVVTGHQNSEICYISIVNMQ